MEQLNGVVERYLAVWNETDTTRRRDLVAETWTHDASYTDPLMQRDGHVDIDFPPWHTRFASAYPHARAG
jgi:hypothetical protein